MPSVASVGSGGANKTVTKMTVGVSGVHKNVTNGWVGVSGVWKKFFVWFTVSVAPTSLTKLTAGTGVIFTDDPAVVTVTGGSGSFTYAWVPLVGDSDISATSPTSASTTFLANLSAFDDFTRSFRCDVTDTSTLEVMSTETITVTITNTL